MALYFVQHKHDPDSCPAKDPQQGNYLLKHLNQRNATTYGVNLLADAVLDGKHTFNLILEAEDQKKLSEFLAPFQQAGSVEIIPASHCETVVDREGC